MISNKKGDHNYILLLFLLFIFVISFTFYACSFNNQPKDKIDVGEEDPFLNQSNTSNNNEDLKSETMQGSKEEETTEEDEQTDLENEEELEEDKDKEEYNSEKNIKSVTLVEIENDVSNTVENSNAVENSSSYTLNLIDMEEPNIKPKKSIHIFDYKKLSLIELKKIIVEKGVVSDASKMKKTDILKLLGEVGEETTE